MKKVLFLACLALLAAACEKKGPEYKNKDDDKSVVLDLKGTIASGVDGLGASWAEGAQISAFVGYSTDAHQLNVQFAASSVDGATASFATKIKKVEEQTSYVAIYPYSKNAKYDSVQDTIGFSLPATQTYVAGGVVPEALPMLAKSSTTELSFQQLCGVFRIALTGEAKVNSIEVEALKIAGPCTVNAGSGAISMKSTATDKITLSFSETATLSDTPTAFNVVVPPGTYSAVYYTIFAEDGTQMAAYDEDVVITKGSVTNAKTTVYSSEAPEEVNPDLTADGFANCYMVTAPGKYFFKCGIPDGNGTIAKGASVKWVWAISGAWATKEEASVEKLVKDITYDSAKDEIQFTVPEDYTYGNVLIALLDADTKISYGWHIWLTNKVNTVNIGGVEFMDRNLGAGGVLNVNDTDANAINNSVGLNYQWGRKDAHPGALGFVKADETTAFAEGSTPYSVINTGIANVDTWKMAAYDLNPDLSKLMNAAQNPCTLVSSAANEAIFPACGLNQWPAEADPCPFGYHVPSREQFNKLTGEGVEATSAKNEENNLIAAAIFNGSLVIPVCGYRNSSKAKAPIDGRYWSQDHESTNKLHGYWYQISTAKVSSQTANEIHSAYVRCVKN